MEAQDDLDEYRPRERDARLVLSVEPGSKTPLRTWVLVAGVGAVGLWHAAQIDRLDIGAALVLPMLFFFAGVRVLTPRPVRTVLRFLDEGVELATAGRGWVRVPWDLITRLVMDGVGGASLDTGTPEEGGRSLARLPKDQLDELLGAAVLPAHVVLVEAPVAAAPKSSWKTFALWVALITMFAAIWGLTQP